MENLIVEGKITATSKRNDDQFQQETATKTAYITVTDQHKEKLEKFGLQKYTSQEGDEYFIIKFPKVLKTYLPNGMATDRPDLSQIEVDGIETNNFKTPDNKNLMLNIIKGNHKNNDFFRLQAIRLETEDDIEEIKPENPFGDDLAF